MAALMRLSRPFNLLGRTLFNSPKLQESHHIYNAQACLNRFQTTSAQEQRNDSIYQDIYKRLDYNKGISTKKFTLLYSALQKKEKLSDQDANLLLHICAKGPFDAPGQRRMELVNDIWSNIEKQGMQISTKLFNMRLKTFKESRSDFDPLQEMNYMKTLGISPDRITCGLLIDGFCHKPDIAGANLILETMKELNFPLDVNVFNSFITGHLRSGQLKEAESVFELLKSRDLQPNADTYLRFAEYFAGKGDLESVNKYIDSADELGISLHQNRLLYIYQTFVSRGHIKQAQEFLSPLSARGTFRSNSFEAVCQLIAEGYAKEGLQLYTMMPKIDESNTTIDDGSFMLLAMVINNYDANALLDMADSIVELQPQALPHRHALLYAYKEGRPDLAIELLHLLQLKNHTLKVPHFIPAICHYRDQKNVEGVYNMTSMLLDINFHQDDILDALTNFVYPILIQLKQTRKDITNNSKPEHVKIWNSIFFLEDLKKEGIEVAVKNVDEKQLDGSIINNFEFRYLFAKNDVQSAKACLDAVADFFPKIPGIYKGMLMSMNEEILRRLMNQSNMELLNQCLDYMKEKKLTVRKRFAAINSLPKLPEDIQKKITDLCTNTQYGPLDKQKFLPFTELNKMSKEELENHKKSYPNAFMPSLMLLERALEEKNVEEVKLRLREMQVMNFTLNQRTVARVLSFFIRIEDTESAVFYFNEYKSMVGTSYAINFPLFTAALQVRKRNIDGALQMIGEASCSTNPRTERDRYALIASTRDMFQYADSLSELDAIMDALFKKDNFVTYEERKFVLLKYMTGVFEKADDEELMKRILKVHQEFKVFPYMVPILVRLIKNQNVAKLKVAMDIGISVMGNNLFHHRLADSFLEAGMPAKALVVLQTPGLTIFEKEMMRTAERFIGSKNISALESLADIAKNFRISREAMLANVIKCHVALSDMTKAVDVLNVFDEECIIPQQSTVDLLVNALNSNNMEIPTSVLKYAKKHQISSSSESDSSSSLDSDVESSSSQPLPKQTVSKPTLTTS